jgi:hypothetical protein
MRTSGEIAAFLEQAYEDIASVPRVFANTPDRLESILTTIDYVQRFVLGTKNVWPHWTDFCRHLGIPDDKSFSEWYASQHVRLRGAERSEVEGCDALLAHWKDYLEWRASPNAARSQSTSD